MREVWVQDLSPGDIVSHPSLAGEHRIERVSVEDGTVTVLFLQQSIRPFVTRTWNWFPVGKLDKQGRPESPKFTVHGDRP